MKNFEKIKWKFENFKEKFEIFNEIFWKNEEIFEKFVENFLSVLAVVETGPSLLEFFRVSGGTFPRFPSLEPLLLYGEWF